MKSKTETNLSKNETEKKSNKLFLTKSNLLIEIFNLNFVCLYCKLLVAIKK